MSILKRLGIQADNFFFHYAENGRIPSYYSQPKGTPEELKDSNAEAANSSNLTIVNCIPPYLEHTTLELGKGYRSIDSHYRRGYLLDFTGFSDADDYIKARFGSKGLRKVRKELRRLEQNLGIELQVIYGEIQVSTYESLMEALRMMIRSRFRERSENHFAIKHWEDYKASLLNMILLKRASLFVFARDNMPVSISVNYHCNEVLASMMTSFDQEYSQYGPGKLMLLTKIYWCFENGYSKMDLAWGDYPHKGRLANVIYKYKSQIIYKEGNPLMLLAAKIMSFGMERKYIFSLNRNG